MSALFVFKVVNHSVVHNPFFVAPLGKSRVLDVRNFARLVEDLHSHALKNFVTCLVFAGVNEPLHFAAGNFLNDDVILRLKLGVALNFVVDDVVISGVRPRHYVFVEKNCANGNYYAQKNCGGGNTAETYSARFHCRNFTGT